MSFKYDFSTVSTPSAAIHDDDDDDDDATKRIKFSCDGCHSNMIFLLFLLLLLLKPTSKCVWMGECAKLKRTEGSHFDIATSPSIKSLSLIPTAIFYGFRRVIPLADGRYFTTGTHKLLICETVSPQSCC